jgi:adenylyltransferase/sulfurtransferase
VFQENIEGDDVMRLTVNKKEFAEQFYSRQVALKELGLEGQRRLSASKVAVIGVGGLGTVAALYLALAGVGYLRLIDQDTVELHNLHRQILYSTEDLKYPKAEAAANRLKRVNPLVKVEPVPENLHAANAEALLKGVDCVVDGLDNIATRYIVNQACAKLRIPYVFAAAIGFEGNLSVFSPPETPCLECLMPGLSDSELQTCATRGVIGATAGIVGTMEALETIKLLTHVGATLKGKLMVCDFSDMYFASIDVSKRQDCPICQAPAAPSVKAEKLVWLCGRNTANVNPEKTLELNLENAQKTIQQKHFVRVKSKLAIVFNYEGKEVTLFRNGRMLIKNVADEDSALKTYHEILAMLSKTSASSKL